MTMPMHGTATQANKRALLKVLIPAKPPAKQEEESFILAVGQREGEITVLEIDEKAGIVKVDDFGTITNLNFENNGVKLASSAPPGAPGAPPTPGAVVPGAPPMNPAFTPGGGHPGRAIPGRPMRTDPRSAAASGGYGGMPTYSAVGSAPGYATPGTVALGGLGAPASTPNAQQYSPQQPQLTPEQAAIMEAAYTLKNQKAISQGIMPPIPGSNPILDGGNTSPKSY